MTTRRSRARQTPDPDQLNLNDYRYDEHRKNNPPAGLAAQARLADAPRQRYSYNPHLPPALRFDPTGAADKLPALLGKARHGPLSEEEVRILAEALRHQEPWLEWSGKREKRWFDVDPVALHIHERVSAQAIVRVAKRQDVQRSLFADPEQEYNEAIRFYQYDVDWANRLILGDSLVVMSSLAKREDLAGKVQMIYMDPPYGIRFGSNFQPFVRDRNVRDREEDLTREPEMVKAYRDTWTLGVHSYLTYLRDRFMVAKELLSDSGSIFVQIGDENLHRVKCVLDEVFGTDNHVLQIAVQKTGSLTGDFIKSNCDYLLWYAKDKDQAKEKFRSLYGDRDDDEREWSPDPLTSSGPTTTSTVNLEVYGRVFHPGTNSHWKTNPDGMQRLLRAERIIPQNSQVRFKKYYDDFPVKALGSVWNDTGGAADMVYVVQTANKVIQRCMLMTTDPGDLVLDPTCGSGTTAYVAEQWGRRWITIDTSRVAVALARQRLLTARFDYFKTRDGNNRVHAESFVYRTVPHITLKSIAQNTALDPIIAKWEPVLAGKLAMLNPALEEVTPNLRATLLAKLEAKRRRRDRSEPVTDADERRWNLPKDKWEEWQVPFATDPDWPPFLQEALTDYRTAWRAKMDEVNACIGAAAEQEVLVDQPEMERGVVRVSGPFTVEAVQPQEQSLDTDGDSPIGGEPEDALDTFGGDGGVDMGEAINAEAYLDTMIRLLRADGVRFPDNKVMAFARLEPSSDDLLHAEGEWANGDGVARRVAVAFGPQYGAISASQVEGCLHSASRRGYDDLVLAGFSFDDAAQVLIQQDPNPRVRLHLSHISPDVNMGGLLKQGNDSQLFTVFGLPRTELRATEAGEWTIEMQGVDVYDPVANALIPTGADKVAAWFLDSDYDGRTFCITQAFFPDSTAWDRLARALKGTVDEAAFAAFSGTVSLPFPTGKHTCAAVKVIDPRGNEVMRVHQLGEARYGRA